MSYDHLPKQIQTVILEIQSFIETNGWNLPVTVNETIKTITIGKPVSGGKGLTFFDITFGWIEMLNKPDSAVYMIQSEIRAMKRRLECIKFIEDTRQDVLKMFGEE